MKQPRLYLTLGLFGALLIYVLFTQTGGKDFNTVKLPKLKTISAVDMTRVEIRRPGQETLRLEKKDSAWRLLQPVDFAADANKVKALESMLADLRLTDVISRDPDPAADYAVNTATALTLLVAGSKGATFELQVGNANSAGTHTYVRLPGDQTIYQVLGDITQQLTRSPLEWRSLQIFDFSTDQARSVVIAQKNRPVVELSKQEEVQPQPVAETPQGVTPAALPAKTVWKAKGGQSALNDPKITQFLNGFCRLTATAIADAAPAVGQPMAEVKVKTLDQEYVLEMLNRDQTDKNYRVRRRGESTVYVIPEYTAQALLKTIKDFE